jgi:hypothetical protein
MPTNSRQHLQLTHALEQKYIPSIARIILKFRKQFISILKESSPQAARASLNSILLNEDIAKVITSIYRTAGLTGAKRQYQKLKRFIPEQKAGGFGRNEQWIRYVIDYLRIHNLEMVAEITDTMRSDILKILERAADEGLSIADTVRELSKTGLVESRARVIARTEINRAVNVGHSAAAKTMPFETVKKWNAARDHRTRHSHVLINGTIVDEDGFFEVRVEKGGTEQMLYPGDPNATAGNTINCRCNASYLPKRDANGNLIMRQQNQAPVIPMRRPRQVDIPGIAAVLKSNIHIGVE